MVSQHEAEVHRSTADLAVLADPCATCLSLAAVVPARSGGSTAPQAVPAPPAPPAAGEPLRAGHVLAALAERLPGNAIVIEESPSSRPELITRLPARESLGYLSPAMGGLGFALPAATGLRLAQTERPVVAIVGDGGVALLDPGALERRDVRCRRAVRDPQERWLCGDGQACRAPRRQRRRGRASTSTSSGWQRPSAARREGSPSTASWSRSSTRSCPASRIAASHFSSRSRCRRTRASLPDAGRPLSGRGTAPRSRSASRRSGPASHRLRGATAGCSARCGGSSTLASAKFGSPIMKS